MLSEINFRRESEGGKNDDNGKKPQEFQFELFNKGIIMLKFGKKGYPHEKVFRLSGNRRFITWSTGWFSDKIGEQRSVDLERVVRIQQGQNTPQFERQGTTFEQTKYKSLSIVYTDEADNETSLDLIAPTMELFKYWMNALVFLLKESASFRTSNSPDLQFARSVCQKVNKDSSGRLSYEEVVRALVEIDFHVSPKAIQSVFNAVDADDSDDLSYEEFFQLLERLRARPDLRRLWESIFTGTTPASDQIEAFNFGDDDRPLNVKEVISVKQFIDFWAKIMGETLTPEQVHIMLFANDPSVARIPDVMNSTAEGKEMFLNKLVISYQQWAKALTSYKTNEAMDPYKAEQHHDMSLPLSQYFIATSHNTYLEGDQLTSASSVNRVIDDLRSGCRCVELDCWDGEKGEPIIYHGFTLNSQIFFKDVIEAIRDHGFVASPYPVILSFENHCSLDQQHRMVYHLKLILKDMLHLPTDNMRQLPSPEELKYKVLLKGRRVGESFEEEDLDDAVISPTRTISATQIKFHRAHKIKNMAKDIYSELSDMIFLGAGRVTDFSAANSKAVTCTTVSSYNENKATAFLSDPEATNGWIRYNNTHISRIYPKGSRILDSSNYNPAPAWTAGSQLVALNYQTNDVHLMANKGKFRENARSGYLLKPDYLRGIKQATRSGPITLTVHIVSGQQLPKPEGQRPGKTFDPYVVAAVVGVPVDCVEYRTPCITDNGFNPVWDVSTTFTISNPDVAVLVLQVWDEDVSSFDFIGYAAYPVLSLRDGLRSCALSDGQGKRQTEFQHASLCVRMHKW